MKQTEGYLLLTAKDSQEQGSWANQGFETCVSKWIYFLHFDRADRILRPRGQGGVKFIVRISENYNLCHANLNTTIKGL